MREKDGLFGHGFPFCHLWLRAVLAVAIGLVSCPALRAQAPADPAGVAAEADAEAGADAVDEEPEAAPAAQRQFKELPVDEGLKRTYITINQMLMSGKFNDEAQKTEFNNFYQKYLLSRWTDPKNVAGLPGFRRELRNSHLGKRSASPQVHEHLNLLVLDFMKDLATGPYHPTVQVNAMLTIGELNSVEQPPTPLPEALPVMIAAVEGADVPDAVRVAALVGIQRHAILGIADADVKKTLITALLKIADGEVPTGSANAGRQWILAQSLETLGILGSPGDGNAVYKAMLASVGNDKLSPATRAAAASSLGALNYSGATGIDPANAATVLGQFVMSASSGELEKAKDSGNPISRQRLMYCLASVTAALDGDGEADHKGIASLATAPNQKKPVDELKKIIGAASSQIEKWREGDDLADMVDKMQADLEKWLDQKG